MDLTFQVSMQYCSLQHQTLLPSPVTSTTGCCFCFGFISSFFLELFLHWSPVAYWVPTDLGSSFFSDLSFCLSYCSQGKNTELVCHSLLQWTTFCQISPPWPVHLGWPYMAWLNFIELDKAVVHVTRLASFLWLWFSLSALWCPLSAPTILLGFLLPWISGISSQLLQQSAAAAPYLGRGVSPHSRHSWPWMWGISSRPLDTPATIVWPQVNNREGTQLHPSKDNWIKDLLSMAPPIRTKPSFPLSQSLP